MERINRKEIPQCNWQPTPPKYYTKQTIERNGVQVSEIIAGEIPESRQLQREESKFPLLHDPDAIRIDAPILPKGISPKCLRQSIASSILLSSLIAGGTFYNFRKSPLKAQKTFDFFVFPAIGIFLTSFGLCTRRNNKTSINF